MEQLIIIVLLFLGSAIFNWLTNRKRQGSEEGAPAEPQPRRTEPTGPPPGRGEPTPRPRQVDWEEELRRLLEGEQPTRPVEPARSPLPPPRPQVRESTPAPSARSQPRPTVRPTPPPLPVLAAGKPQEEEGPDLHLASLTESAAAYQRAGSLDRQVSARLHDVHEHPVVMTHAVHLGPTASEARQIVGLLRNPKSARQAMVASFVFGPPKALEH